MTCFLETISAARPGFSSTYFPRTKNVAVTRWVSRSESNRGVVDGFGPSSNVRAQAFPAFETVGPNRRDLGWKAPHAERPVAAAAGMTAFHTFIETILSGLNKN